MVPVHRLVVLLVIWEPSSTLPVNDTRDTAAVNHNVSRGDIIMCKYQGMRLTMNCTDDFWDGVNRVEAAQLSIEVFLVSVGSG